MAFTRLTFVLLNLVFLITNNCDFTVSENFDELYRPRIWSLVNYLNKDPDRVYNYNYATLINAQNKDRDTVDLTIDVEVECRDPERGLCITNNLQCQGIVQFIVDTNQYITLPGASCQPKVVVDLTKNENKESQQMEQHVAPIFESETGVEVTEKLIVTSRPAPCLGCVHDVNPTANGVDALVDIALKHIQTERDNIMKTVCVLKVQSQVVAGMKYILILEVAPTTCIKSNAAIQAGDLMNCPINANADTQICHIVYISQPGINDKKNIISNNCTEIQDYSPADRVRPEIRQDTSNDMDNEIDVHYIHNKPTEFNNVDNEKIPNYDSIADNGQVDDMLKMPESIMSPMRMKEIDPQIVYKSPEVTTQTFTTGASQLTEEQKAAIDDLLGMMGDQPRKKRNVNDDDDSSSSSEEHFDTHKSKNKKKYEIENLKQKLLYGDHDDTSSSSTSETNNNKHRKRKASSESSVSSSEENKVPPSTTVPTFKRNKRSSTSELVKVSPDEKEFVKKLSDLSISNLDVIDEDSHKRIVLQIMGAKKMNMKDGVLYHLTLRVGISQCHEDTTRNDEYCRDHLFENLTKICKAQVQVDEKSNQPRILKTYCQNMKKDDRDKNRTKRSNIVGGIVEQDPNSPESQQLLKDILQQVDQENGASKPTILVQVVNVTKQVVAGTLTRFQIKIEIDGEEHDCSGTVWDRPWVEKGKEVNIKCGEQSERKYRFRRSTDHLFGKDDHDVHVGMFKSFIRKYNKKYKSKKEFKMRFEIYRKNMKMIKQLNDNEQGTAKYGPTKFTDLTREEFKRYLGFKPSLKHDNNLPWPQAAIPNIELPNEFDWRQKGAVSPVKDQGSCGSCWAFSVTGNIEGLNEINTGKMIELSEQELVDCDSLDDGCSGGLPDNAYRAIETLGGLESETDYPYDGEDEKCHFNKSLSRVQISGAVNISSNETDMAKWLVKNAPISIGINANAMQFYMGGVSHPWKMLCDPTDLDHGVLIVGFGVHKYKIFNKTMPYWIVKNSWGKNWGEQGYYRVYRGDGTCGVNRMASSAIL